MGTYTERIERGAALLDEKRPGWRGRIDLESLDLGDCEYCVIGQLMGGYDRRDVLGLYTRELAAGHGFALARGETTGIGSPEYIALTDEWREYIRQTRAVS